MPSSPINTGADLCLLPVSMPRLSVFNFLHPFGFYNLPLPLLQCSLIPGWRDLIETLHLGLRVSRTLTLSHIVWLWVSVFFPICCKGSFSDNDWASMALICEQKNLVRVILLWCPFHRARVIGFLLISWSIWSIVQSRIGHGF